jgi:hypothetical protein
MGSTRTIADICMGAHSTPLAHPPSPLQTPFWLAPRNPARCTKRTVAGCHDSQRTGSISRITETRSGTQSCTLRVMATRHRAFCAPCRIAMTRSVQLCVPDRVSVILDILPADRVNLDQTRSRIRRIPRDPRFRGQGESKQYERAKKKADEWYNTEMVGGKAKEKPARGKGKSAAPAAKVKPPTDITTRPPFSWPAHTFPPRVPPIRGLCRDRLASLNESRPPTRQSSPSRLRAPRRQSTPS